MEDLRETTAQIVAAYAESNKLGASDLPELIQAVYRTLASAGEPTVDAAPAAIRLTSAQIKKSITPDYLVSFEDGKRYKTMKRHLGRLGLTPDQYRAKSGLPSSYPMVCTNPVSLGEEPWSGSQGRKGIGESQARAKSAS
jgi:predicted transcriptional regulator